MKIWRLPLILALLLLIAPVSAVKAAEEAPAPAAPAAAAPAAPAAPAGPPALELLKDVEFHGFASTAYINNFNNPIPFPGGANAGKRLNNFRTFDNNSNTFSLDTAELVLLKATPKPGDIGFMADMYFGYTIPQTIMSAAPGNTIGGTGNVAFDVKQGFVSWNTPIGNGLNLDLGKFITHMGAEVIEGYSAWNYNYSRSLLFGLAIPFTHTGLRAKYTFNDKLNVLGMVSNTMDNTISPTTAKDLGAELNWTPNEIIALTFNWVGGAAPQPLAFVPRPVNTSNRRDTYDFVATITATDKLTFLLNYDYGIERRGSPLALNQDAEWYGFSGIARYKLDELLPGFSMNLRGETFTDAQGLRTASYMTANAVPGFVAQRLNLWEITLTPEFIISRNLIIRPEYRHDGSDRNAFISSTSTAAVLLNKKGQDTFAVNAMFFF